MIGMYFESVHTLLVGYCVQQIVSKAAWKQYERGCLRVFEAYAKRHDDLMALAASHYVSSVKPRVYSFRLTHQAALLSKNKHPEESSNGVNLCENESGSRLEIGAQTAGVSVHRGKGPFTSKGFYIPHSWQGFSTADVERFLESHPHLMVDDVSGGVAREAQREEVGC
jgi:hypothetical protein